MHQPVTSSALSIVPALLFIGLQTPVAAIAQAENYAIFYLHPIVEGGTGEGWGLNELGDVVGEVDAGVEGLRAARWNQLSDGTWQFTELPGIGGYFDRAYDINDFGQMAGTSEDIAAKSHAMYWEDDQMLDLGTLGGSLSWAHEIDSLGRVVGWALTTNDEAEGAFVWENGVMHDLGRTIGCCSRAYACNDLGWVVGLSTYGEVYFSHNATLWKWANGQVEEVIDLGRLGGHDSEAHAVNNFGQIAGWTDINVAFEHAFIWNAGVMYDIHTLSGYEESFAYGINDWPQVVGNAYVTSEGLEGWPFIWDDGQMTLLDTLVPPRSQWTRLTSALAINNAGQITGVGRRGGGVWDLNAYLLSPVYPSFTLSDASPGIGGQVNTITADGLTPGTRVYFTWAKRGGGRLIPGCDAQTNALQLDNPQIAGTAVADANGRATLKGNVPKSVSGKTLLLQAVIPSSCEISTLVVQTFE